jgi:hypothetical protein
MYCLNYSALGQLTNIGKKSLKSFGNTLRDKYVHDQAFLTESFNSKQVSLRSTNMVRTIESLQSVMDGMYPLQYRSIEPIHVNVLLRREETSIPSHFCPKLNNAISKKRDILMNESMKSEIERITQQLESINPISVIEMYDIFASVVGNQMKLPDGVSTQQYLTLQDITLRYWYGFR